MKVIQINSVVNYGSTGHIVENIGQELLKEKFESYIFYGRNKRSSDSKSFYFSNKLSFCAHLFSSIILGVHGYGFLGSYFFTKKIINKIKALEPDLIHIHNIHGYYLNYKLLFKYLKTLDIPIVWTLHDCWSYTGHCAYYSSENCSKWKVGCSFCKQKRNYPKSLFFDNSKYDYNLKKEFFSGLKKLTLVTPSKWLFDELSFSFLNYYNKKVIPNGIDLSVFRPSLNNDMYVGKFVILGVANVWSSRKGFNDFINLSKKLTRNEIIILIGINKHQLKLLPENIIGIERTESQKELADFYSRANVYFNPSIEETQGLTTVEALACGTPVIVYNKTAVPECVSEEVGYIVEAGNIDEVYGHIKSIRKTDDFVSKEKRRLCCEYAQRYSKEISSKKYIDLYKELLLGV